MRSLWLAKRASRSVAMQFIPDAAAKRLDFRIIVKERDGWKDQASTKADITAPNFEGTIKRGSATCPCCGYTTPVVRVRDQLKVRRGGTDDARLLCVVTTQANEQGRSYRLPTRTDLNAVAAAQEEIRRRSVSYKGLLTLVPGEEICLNEIRRISLPLYGMSAWGDKGVQSYNPRGLLLSGATERPLISQAAISSRQTPPNAAFLRVCGHFFFRLGPRGENHHRFHTARCIPNVSSSGARSFLFRPRHKILCRYEVA